jgi:signal transduction histidine kinase
MEILLQKLMPRLVKTFDLTRWPHSVVHYLWHLPQHIRNIGVTRAMGEYDKRKLGIFNQLNVLQLITGVLVPVFGLLPNPSIPQSVSIIACLPPVLSLLALCLNYCYKHELALLTYFILYPFFTCVVYINSMNLGMDLYFVLYGILAVFFLKNYGYMVFTIAMSMMSYFMLAVVLKHYQYQLAELNYSLYLFNKLLAIIYIFYGLVLVKNEATGYQFSILRKNAALHKKNGEIKQQKREIADKAKLLKVQKQKLSELNGVKDKLFSVVAHDLRAPLYGLRHLFSNMQQYNLPAEEVKEKLPQVLTDVNHTIGLMENLLHWAKSQMNDNAVKIVTVDIALLVESTIKQLYQQAAAKNIYIENSILQPVLVFGDKDMIGLVLRNLLSNAIKFTPQGGYIEIGLQDQDAFVQVYVQDTGVGISAAALQKINARNYYTTTGTESESGTGLGLMLCKEFLAKNGGSLFIESKEGHGSRFFFTVPKADLT